MPANRARAFRSTALIGVGITCLSACHLILGSGDFADQPPTGSGGGGAAASTGGAGEGGSATVTTGTCSMPTDVAPDYPSILLFVDRSSSMASLMGGVAKWDVVFGALFDPTTGVVPPREQRVRFGLTLWEGSATLCPGTPSTSTIAFNNGDTMAALYATYIPGSDSPLGDCIDAAAPTLEALAEPGPKAIVVLMDGMPDTCEQPNPNAGDVEAISAAQTWSGQGMTLSIISLPADATPLFLQSFANAGAGLEIDGTQGNAAYFEPLTATEVGTAFGTIIDRLSCQLALGAQIEDMQGSLGSIAIDGVPIAHDDVDGWVIGEPGVLQLAGEACKLYLTSMAPTVTAEFPCEAFP